MDVGQRAIMINSYAESLCTIPIRPKMHIVPMFSSIISVASFSLDLVWIRRLLDSPKTS
jgi:hypothetical protein